MNAPDSIEDRFWRTAASIAAQAPDTNPYRTYESIKGLWTSNHPFADAREYEAAMDRIARLVGV